MWRVYWAVTGRPRNTSVLRKSVQYARNTVSSSKRKRFWEFLRNKWSCCMILWGKYKNILRVKPRIWKKTMKILKTVRLRWKGMKNIWRTVSMESLTNKLLSSSISLSKNSIKHSSSQDRQSGPLLHKVLANLPLKWPSKLSILLAFPVWASPKEYPELTKS